MKRFELLESIVQTTLDYRDKDLKTPTPEHVERWIRQFDDSVQQFILEEMDFVLKKTYFSKKRVIDFLQRLLVTKELVGDNPAKFWRSVNFLNIQRGGNSQREMLALFSEVMIDSFGFSIDECGNDNSNLYIYLDDITFTGNRVWRDLEQWLDAGEMLSDITINIITIGNHEGGYYYADRMIKDKAKHLGINMNLGWWSDIELEDRKTYTRVSDVLRPISIPDLEDVNTYVNTLSYPPFLRQGDSIGGLKLFSSPEKRHILEQEFLKMGVKIRQMCPNLPIVQRPLGHSKLQTVGFGSLLVTFRNCPNNTPLVLWVDDPWYPLFKRLTNTDVENMRLIN